MKISALLTAATLGAAGANAAPNASSSPLLHLGPELPLAVALNGLLPAVPSDELALSSWQTEKQALISAGEGQQYLVTCVTELFQGRAPEPVPHFKGCSVKLSDEAVEGVKVLTLGDLFQLAVTPVPVTPTPVGFPRCPRCN